MDDSWEWLQELVSIFKMRAFHTFILQEEKEKKKRKKNAKFL